LNRNVTGGIGSGWKTFWVIFLSVLGLGVVGIGVVMMNSRSKGSKGARPMAMGMGQGGYPNRAHAYQMNNNRSMVY
jgi:dephospho-CoA kinase